MAVLLVVVAVCYLVFLEEVGLHLLVAVALPLLVVDLLLVVANLLLVALHLEVMLLLELLDHLLVGLVVLHLLQHHLPVTGPFLLDYQLPALLGRHHL